MDQMVGDRRSPGATVLEGPMSYSSQEDASFAMDHDVKGERTHKQHRTPTGCRGLAYVQWCVSSEVAPRKEHDPEKGWKQETRS